MMVALAVIALGLIPSQFLVRAIGTLEVAIIGIVLDWPIPPGNQPVGPTG
jgi:hypothetical protein